MCSEYTHFQTGLILVCLVALCNKIYAMTIPLHELMISYDTEITS